MATPILFETGPTPPVSLMPRRLLQWMFMVIAMAGAFTPARILPQLQDFGFLMDPRVVFGALFFGIGLLLFVSRGGLVRARGSEWLWYGGFFALHILVFASYQWSLTPWMAEQQLADLALLILFVIIYSQLFALDPRDSIHLMFASCIALSLPFLPLALMILTSDAGSLLTGFTGGMGGIGMARLFGLAAIAVVYYSMRTGRRWPLGLLPFYAAGIMVSGSRAALLALTVAFAFLWWRRRYVGQHRQGSWAARVIAVTTGVVALVAFFLTPFGLSILEAFVLSNFVESAGSNDAGAIYLADRDVIFQHALGKLLEDPVTGLGIGSYEGPFGEPYPHNLILLYATDAGILAAVMVLGFVALFALMALRCRDDWTVGAATAGVFLLVASMFAGSYYDARVFWFLSLALVIHHARQAGTGHLRPGTLLRLARRQ